MATDGAGLPLGRRGRAGKAGGQGLPSPLIPHPSSLPEPRWHQAHDLDTVIAFAVGYENTAVWYSPTAVVVLLDDDERRDRVTWHLGVSGPFAWLRGQEAGAAWLPRPAWEDAVEYLLRGCDPPASGLAAGDVNLHLPVFAVAVPGVGPQVLRCRHEYNPAADESRLRPYPGECARVEVAAVRDLGAEVRRRLRDLPGVQVYCGYP